MSRAASIAAVLACLLGAGCSLGAAGGGRGDGGRPDAGVRAWAPTLVHWSEGQPRAVELAIENSTLRTLTIPAPDAANARVDVFAGPESIRVCGAAPREGRAASRGETVALAPGDRVAVRIELDEACAGVPPGDYRYEVSYRFPDTGKGGIIAGTLPTSYGQLVVEADAGPAPARRVRARSVPERR